MKFEDITWEMYCEYLGVPVFEPFKNLDANQLQDHILHQRVDEVNKVMYYQDFFICTMDKNHFLNSRFHKYLVNKNRLDLINKILDR